ncbi:MAG: glycosyltransferase [Patescibacteria group bacterium]
MPDFSSGQTGDFFKKGNVVYLGLCSDSDIGGFYVAVKYGDKITVHKIDNQGKRVEKAAMEWLDSYSRKIRSKIVAAGFSGFGKAEKITSVTWRKFDIVPFIFRKTAKTSAEQAERNCYRAAGEFNKENLPSVKVGKKREVKVPRFCVLDDYKETVSKKEFDFLLETASEFKKKDLKMVFFSSTKSGGGVALMRHALIRLYKLLGVKVSWHVMNSKKEIFNISKKKFHNILQGVAPAYVKLTENEMDDFKRWSRENADNFKKLFQAADVIVIDDPQPSGMIPHIKEVNPDAKILYRSHIQIEAHLIDEKQPQQWATWKLIWDNIKDVDLFISHPIKEFVPACIPSRKVVYMPATTDKLDGLNKELEQRHLDYYFDLFNSLVERNGQSDLDLKRPYIIQVARFDPSKGIPHLIEAYRTLREKMAEEGYSKKKTPQLVIVGNGAVDDPEGASLYTETMQILSMDTYVDLASDVKVAKLPHCDQLLNTLLRGAVFACQLSLKEGFEVKVSETLLKGKPVIAYRTGGIPLQIEHGVSGYLVEPGNTHQVAEYAYDLLSDKELYKKMSREAQRKADLENTDYFTVNNAYKWLYLALQLVKEEKIEGDYRDVNEIIKEKKDKK